MGKYGVYLRSYSYQHMLQVNIWWEQQIEEERICSNKSLQHTVFFPTYLLLCGWIASVIYNLHLETSHNMVGETLGYSRCTMTKRCHSHWKTKHIRILTQIMYKTYVCELVKKWSKKQLGQVIVYLERTFLNLFLFVYLGIVRICSGVIRNWKKMNQI